MAYIYSWTQISSLSCFFTHWTPTWNYVTELFFLNVYIARNLNKWKWKRLLASIRNGLKTPTNTLYFPFIKQVFVSAASAEAKNHSLSHKSMADLAKIFIMGNGKMIVDLFWKIRFRIFSLEIAMRGKNIDCPNTIS